MIIGLLSAFTTRSFGGSLVSNFKRYIKGVSLNNRPCQARPTIVDRNSNETLFLHFLSMLINVVELVILLMIHMLENVFQIM